MFSISEIEYSEPIFNKDGWVMVVSAFSREQKVGILTIEVNKEKKIFIPEILKHKYQANLERINQLRQQILDRGLGEGFSGNYVSSLSENVYNEKDFSLLFEIDHYESLFIEEVLNAPIVLNFPLGLQKEKGWLLSFIDKLK